MTIMEQIEALRVKYNGRVVTRECSMCGYELAYMWKEEGLFFDTGCHCTYMRGGLEPRTIDHLKEFMEMNPGWAERQLAS
jgi:hypothetical protein